MSLVEGGIDRVQGAPAKTSPSSPDDVAFLEGEYGEAWMADDSDNPEEKVEEGANDGDGSSASSTIPPPLPPFTKLLNLARPEFFLLALAFAFMVASEASHLCIPLLLANAYDDLVDPAIPNDERMSAINEMFFWVLIIHGSGMFLSFARSAMMGIAGERVVARLRNRLYASILAQEIGFFDEHRTGELVSRLGSDTTLVQMATSVAVPEVILGVVKLGVSVGLMFWISPRLAGVALGFVFGIFALCVPFGKTIGKLSKRYQDALGAAQIRSTEALGAMRTVQSFAAEEREVRRYEDAVGDPDMFFWWQKPKDKPTTHCSSPAGTTDFAKKSVRGATPLQQTTYGVGYPKSIWTSGFYTFIFGAGFLSMYVSLWYGFRLVVDGRQTLGDLTAFQSYVFQIGGSLASTSRFLSQLIEARGASGRIFQLLERVPLIPGNNNNDGSDSKTPTNASFNNRKEANGASGDKFKDEEQGPADASSVLTKWLKPKAMEGLVQFHSVSFSYPSRPNVPVLQKFSLAIPVGSTAAIVGSSGAGKSTVVSLLQRFYDVTSGSVTIDGHDVRALDLHWMRERMGYVQQEPQLFGMTVRENVCYGLDRPVTDEEVVDACREANAHDFVLKWPDGYDTMVGERGVTLSGGQKQRIAIARALLVKPSILLLDEATSALDAESEHLVQEAIDKAVRGRTVLIVAHRLSTIRNADQIVVLDGREIVDMGPHDILMGRCDKYRDLIKRQSVVRGPPESL